MFLLQFADKLDFGIMNEICETVYNYGRLTPSCGCLVMGCHEARQSLATTLQATLLRRAQCDILLNCAL